MTKAVVAKPAPDFKAAVANPDLSIGAVTLSQFKGKYVVLFFYPLVSGMY